MINVLLDKLPTEWNGYKINTDFQIGIQLQQLQEDKSLNEMDKTLITKELLFSDRDCPNLQGINECVKWFLTEWNHDNSISDGGKADNKKYLDFDVDQWRIYADFLREYHIDLATEYVHWWKFNGLLWNLPSENSAFLQTINIRKKKIDNKMSKEYKESLKKQKKIYDLNTTTRELTDKEKSNMDEFYSMLEK